MNRIFIILDLNEDECDKQSTNSHIMPRPPSIFVQKDDCVVEFTKTLSVVIVCEYHLKILKSNQVKILIDNTIHFLKIINLLK